MLKAESFRTPLVLNQPLEIPSPQHIPLSRDGVLMSSLSSLNDYWRLHSDELAERILASYLPLYGLDDAPSPALSQMLRTPPTQPSPSPSWVSPSAGRFPVAPMSWPNVERAKP